MTAHTDLNQYYTNKALNLVSHDFNESFFPGDVTKQAVADDFYVVWFVKVLGNWKAMVSTDIVPNQYWEVTYNGAKEETYVDHYIKHANLSISDLDYDGLLEDQSV